MKILHVITGLGDGGAEAVLFRLCTYDKVAEHIVISLMGSGKYGPELEKRGVRVYSLGMQSGWLSLRAVARVHRIINDHEPDVIQGWMYHGNIIATLAKIMVGRNRVFWGIRHSELSRASTSRRTLLIAKTLGIGSRWLPERIVYCAMSARTSHEEYGFARTKGVVVPNGYDLSLFTKSVQSRSKFRKAIGLDDSVPLIGVVARWHPDKDHGTFIQSLRFVLQSFPETRVLLVGAGMEASNAELVELLDRYAVREECLLLGQLNDIPALMNAIDLHVLSSSTEAFPNVLAEAMSCGTPCVSTDVGDAKEIVGDTGWVVPRRAPVALAEALVDAVGALHTPIFEERRNSARERIVSKFSIESMIEAFHWVWFSIERGSGSKAALD